MSPEAIAEILTENKKLKDENEDLKERIQWFERQIHGSKSERFIPADDNQTTLALEVMAGIVSKPTTETITYERKVATKRTPHAREEIPSHLPRKEITIVPNDIDLNGSQRIGEKITEQVEYKPPQYFVNKIVRPVFAVVIDNVRTLVCAELPKNCNEKGKYGPSFIAHVTVGKFEDHTPIFRQQKQIARDSAMLIPEATLDRLPEVAAFWLDPIAERLREMVLRSQYIQMDESSLRVMIKPTKGKSSTGYIWLRHAPEHHIVVFDYDRHRSAKVADRLIGGYRGILQTDGYVVYNVYSKTPGVLHANCNAHARRGFEESKNNDQARAVYALNQYQELFEIEREARQRNLSADQRLELRKERSVTIIERMKKWLDENVAAVRPKSNIGKAILYCLNRWKELTAFLEDGRIELSTNLVENCVRPFALGRKNWLFAGSEEAAGRMATLFTIIGTCRLLGINSFEYITHALQELPNRDSKNIDDLLPMNWKPVPTK